MSTYQFDVKCPALIPRFNRISINGLLDPGKFMDEIKQVWGKLADSLLLILASFFDDKTPPFTQRGYANLMSKVLN